MEPGGARPRPSWKLVLAATRLRPCVDIDVGREHDCRLLGTFRRRDELADPEFLISISSGDLNVLPTVALNFENLVAKVLPITISSAAMVKEKGRLIGIGIFELDEHFSTLDNPAALCALLYFRHCFLTYRGLEQAFAMLMGDTQAS
jgi:hypothetical protein